MIFKVSEKFKGSCVLPTINRAIWANMTISITGNDLRASDVKDVVRKGILIPVDEDYDHDAIEKDHDVIIVNNTDKVLVLGRIALRPNGSLPISKDEAKILEIIAAAKDGSITILSDEEEEPYIKKVSKKKTTKKAKKAKKVEVIEELDYVAPETGEDKEPTATTWDFREKKSVEAIKVPKSEDFLVVGEDEKDDLDFIDAEEEVEVKKTTKKKTTKKKIAKKKTTKKKVVAKKTKKKETKRKSKKVKTLQPVGEKRLPKTEMDAIMELDSRGNPIGDKPGDTLRHLIDSIDTGKDVGFVDDEQSLDRYKKRTDMD